MFDLSASEGIEKVIGAVKRFKLLSERYRSCRKRFGLRINLIAAIYNRQIDNLIDD